jgi:lipopolysaccharide/colanic/teichoic acid biosynthesis glycosyltransferase
LIDIDLLEGEITLETTLNVDQQRSETAQEDVAVPAYFAWKAWPTRTLGALLLVLASPIILLLVLVVRLTSAGPGLYRQARAGRHGREFIMFKIRTMYENAESDSGPVWCIPNDTRITPVGQILRLLHLDELPQLINVARGEMDLIGPRPERPVFVNKLASRIPNYHSRLRILPGVTGLAQINLPSDESIDCVRRKLVLDCLYIREANLGMDVRILLCTFLRMIGIRHGRAVRWLRLERHVNLPRDTNNRFNETFTYRPPQAMEHTIADGFSVETANGAAVIAIAADGGSGRSIVFEPASAAGGSPRLPR